MAKTRNDVPPGGDAGGIFDKDNRPDPVAPASHRQEATAALLAEEDKRVLAAFSPPPEPKPEGPKTTRGMNPVLKAADLIWKELKDLTPAEREWVRGFIDSQFPKPPGA